MDAPDARLNARGGEGPQEAPVGGGRGSRGVNKGAHASVCVCVRIREGCSIPTSAHTYPPQAGCNVCSSRAYDSISPSSPPPSALTCPWPPPPSPSSLLLPPFTPPQRSHLSVAAAQNPIPAVTQVKASPSSRWTVHMALLLDQDESKGLTGVFVRVVHRVTGGETQRFVTYER